MNKIDRFQDILQEATNSDLYIYRAMIEREIELSESCIIQGYEDRR